MCSSGNTARKYEPRQPGLLRKLVQEHLDELIEGFQDESDPDAKIPEFVEKELRAFVDCGDLDCGFTWLRCSACQRNRFLPFSCKTSICPSCGAREMQNTTSHLLDNVLPDRAMRQWIISPPFELRGLLAAKSEVLNTFTRLFVDAVFKVQKRAAGVLGIEQPQCGGIAFLQRFSKTLVVLPHIHMLALDGVYVANEDDPDAPVRGELLFRLLSEETPIHCTLSSK